MDVKAVVCLPTYNERENLERMLRALADKGVEVLVIDDNSPDGTGELADRLAAELDFVSVLHRERKEGLGPAYLAGFGRALAGGAELVLGVPVHDLTGGFKCFRREVLEVLDLHAIASRGYAFQIETTYRALRAGFRVVEVPIRFVDREHGGSKMSRSIFAEAVWKVPVLRLRALTGRL